MDRFRIAKLFLGACCVGLLGLTNTPAATEIPRTIPPPGIEVPAEDLERLRQALQEQQGRLDETPFGRGPTASVRPDIEIYLKAVGYAIEHGEFFDRKDVGRAEELLKTAAERIDQLAERTTPWIHQRGLVVRGFRSKIDDSVQPYGLVIPEGLDLSQPVPLYVWLHGRGDKATDLQFIHQRQTTVGQISPQSAIVLHPFGRYCNAFKFAGETDVLEAIDSVAERYPIDRLRIVLWGFSMGGAGAWHLGAHYPDRWVVVSPGAGFAETARYQRLDPDTVPARERILWGLYDVPNYARNLLNVPVIAYSGELDKQIQAARVMEQALEEHGLRLKHLIGPGMGHKYHPDTLKELAALVEAEVTKGQDPYPREIHLQTRTLRYGHCHWLTIQGLEEHWKDARVDAWVVGHQEIRIDTRNVTSLHVDSPWRTGSGFTNARSLVIDGVTKKLDWAQFRTGFSLTRNRATGAWSLRQESRATAAPTAYSPLAMQTVEERAVADRSVSISTRGSRSSASQTPAKIPGLQGPIDDVFYEPFLVVMPSGKSSHEQVEKWVNAEAAHFKDRWRRLFRGDLRTKMDYKVTDEDLKTYHVILWGDRISNRLTAKVVDSLPIKWTQGAVAVGSQSYPSADHVLSAIYPNPESPSKYVVLNSGLTFREQHDRTNSQQNPKLPDWAVIDLSQPPDAASPGRIVLSGFFDEAWQLKDPL